MHPVKALKGFAKVRLGPGESTTVDLELNERSFAYWDVADTEWPKLLERNEGVEQASSDRPACLVWSGPIGDQLSYL